MVTTAEAQALAVVVYSQVASRDSGDGRTYVAVLSEAQSRYAAAFTAAAADPNLVPALREAFIANRLALGFGDQRERAQGMGLEQLVEATPGLLSNELFDDGVGLAFSEALSSVRSASANLRFEVMQDERILALRSSATNESDIDLYSVARGQVDRELAARGGAGDHNSLPNVIAQQRAAEVNAR